MKQLRAHTKWTQVKSASQHSHHVVHLHCSSSAKITQIHTHHKIDSVTQLWLCLLHWSNTNCTKIEIDRKIGDLTSCLIEYAESLALVKLNMYTCYFHDHEPTCLSAIQIGMWLSLSVLYISSFFGAFSCWEEINCWQLSSAHAAQSSTHPKRWLFLYKREDEIYIG